MASKDEILSKYSNLGNQRAKTNVNSSNDVNSFVANDTRSKSDILSKYNVKASNVNANKIKSYSPSNYIATGKDANGNLLIKDTTNGMNIAQDNATGAYEYVDPNKTDKVNVGKLLKGIAWQGVDRASSRIANTLDFVLGGFAQELWNISGLNNFQELNPISKMASDMNYWTEKRAAEYAGNASSSKLASIANEYGSEAIASLPLAVMAIMTSGTSLGATTGTLASNAAVETATGAEQLRQIATNAISAQVTDPNYWAAFSQVTGESYRDAIMNGSSEEDATLYALTNGTLNSIIEVGGGIQTLPKNLQAIVNKADGKVSYELFKTMIEEGGEEVKQGIVERAMQNLALNRGNALASLTDENAILNPATAGKEFAGGAVVGGLLGGGQVGVNVLLQEKAQNDYFKDMYGKMVQDLVNESNELNPNNKLAQDIQKKIDKNNNISGRQIGKLVNQNEADIYKYDLASITEAAENQLKAYGETDNVHQLATAIGKYTAGEKLSNVEQKLISESKYGVRVANELDPQRINSGEYNTAWAEGLNTTKINPAEYGRMVATMEETPMQTANIPQSQQSTAQSQQTNTVVNNETTSVEAKSEPQATQSVTASTPVQQETTTAKEPATDINSLSKKYGPHAKAFISTYNKGQDVEKFDKAYQRAYEYGASGVPFSAIRDSISISYLTDAQKEIAYDTGSQASEQRASEKKNGVLRQANGKTGKPKGTVKLEGKSAKELNSQQRKATRVLRTVSEATGINVVLYASETDAEGNYVGANGRFEHSQPDTIYIDLNSGLLNSYDETDIGKYAMLRTFSHEFVHFVEHWNPIQYNELRRAVFDEIESNGNSTDDLIQDKMRRSGIGYEAASREVVAESLTDILPQASFVENLATNHKGIFNQLVEKLKAFVNNLKAYFNEIGANRSSEAAALKKQLGDTIKYGESIVNLFDNVAEQAVVNYQQAFAVDEETGSIETVEEPVKAEDENAWKNDLEISNKDKFLIHDYIGKFIKGAKAEGIDVSDLESELNNGYVKGYTVNSVRDFIEKTIPIAKQVDSDLPVTYLYNAVMLANLSDEYDISVFKKEKTETVEEVAEETEEQPEARTSTSDYGFTVTDNVEHEGVEVHFDNGKPSQAVIDTLKSMKMRWHGKNKFWYGKVNHDDLFNALEYTYAKENGTVEKELAEAKAEPKVEDTVAEEVSEAIENDEPIEYSNEGLSDNEMTEQEYTDAFTSFNDEEMKLYNRIVSLDSVQIVNGFGYSLNAYTNSQQGKIYKAEINRSLQGDMPIFDARALYSAKFRSRHNAAVSMVMVAKNNKLLGETVANNTEEEKPNGSKNENNEGTVRSTSENGQGDSRLLATVETEPVQRASSDGRPSSNAAEQGGGTGRNGEQSDSEAGTGRSTGSSESRVSGLNELTPEQEAKKQEQLHETVEAEIEQKSTETPKGKNFVINDSLELPKGEKERFRANVDAIKLIKKLDTEGRYATPAEQKVLSKYVGWGGLSNAFGQYGYNSNTRRYGVIPKSGWEAEYAELNQLVEDGIITKQEYDDMSASTKNAHYTSVEVINGMYEGLSRLGFKGGRMLEPSCGVGNFVGGMPLSMAKKVNSFTMVELDRITGQIAKYLYPNNDVRIQGFQEANIPNNFIDVAIGNVPFGKYGVIDRSYPKYLTKSIHNYFFAKSIDKVRPGGLVMFITSHFTMDAENSAIREYMMSKADFIGAVRLPDTAFKSNAGTSVVSDIIILKKRAEGTKYAGEAFQNVENKLFSETGWASYNINEYFAQHPEMVLGTAEQARGMYGPDSYTVKAFEDKGSLGSQVAEAISSIKVKMDYKAMPTPEKSNFAVERASKKPKDGGYVVKEGKLYQNKDGKLTETTSKDGKDVERITGLVNIRDKYQELINYQLQGLDAKFIKKARKELNTAYDTFVKKYGYINSPKNKAAMSEMVEEFSLRSLENYDAKKKTATKSDIFTKDTIRPNKTVTSVNDINEGIIVSINRKGGIDAKYISELTGKTEQEATREMIDNRLAFKTADGLVAPETYLSGNVRAKLREAEAMAAYDKDYENNVEELKRVIPKDIEFQDISVAVGTQWVPVEVYADFIANMLGSQNVESDYRPRDIVVTKTLTGDYKIAINNSRLKQNSNNTQKWGTKRRTFLNIVEAMMNNGSLTVNDTIETVDGKKKSVINKQETVAVQSKADEISKEFKEWIWQDEARKTELSKLYNETFNALVNPKYSGENLTVNGLNPEFDLREHQSNAVQRIISSGGNTLLAHRVGAGKTLEMASAAMKLRELGIVKKPMFVVPKSLVAQWGNEFKSYFPASKLLVSDDKSFTPANRRTNANRIANGDFDAVIVSYEQFEKIPMSKEYMEAYYQAQIDEVLQAIAEAKAEHGQSLSIKQMEATVERLKTKLASLSTKAKDEDNIIFENLGVDSLFVDEAHNFKNLFYTTKMHNVSGLGNTDGSQRAMDMYTKIRYLQQLNGGKGIVFATATPVMNSMAEMYIMQKYLQSDALEQLGLRSFDAWAKQFGEIVNGIEIKPSGQGFRVKQSFSNFVNLNELQLQFRSFADVLTEVPGLKIPKMRGGKVITVECELGEYQKQYMKDLEKRADNVKNVDPSEDNMLKITSDGRKISYSQKMIDPSLPYEANCKIFRCCDNIYQEYIDSTDKVVYDEKEEKDVKLLGTQIVFCDMGTPNRNKKATSKSTEAETDDETETSAEAVNVYNDMKEYLIQRGIPAEEIAFIHDAKTDEQKAKLFERVNKGEVRVLIGSTGKMGVGMNAQKRVVAIHHLDAPWRPGDVEQRDGRAFRQGNINSEVAKYTYVSVGSFDARLWDILDRKQHFINQIMNGDDVGRSAEDTGDVTLSAAEVKALASGNPLVREIVEVDAELDKLADLKKAYDSSIVLAKSKLLKDEQLISQLTKAIELGKQDIKARKDTYSDNTFSMEVDGKTFKEKKDAGALLAAEIVSKATDANLVTVGKFAGFELKAIKTEKEYIGYLSGKQNYKFNVYPDNTTYMVNHIIGVVENLETKVGNWGKQLEETKADKAAQEKLIQEPFKQADKFKELQNRHNEIMAILNPPSEQVLGDADTQEQARENLSDEALNFKSDVKKWYDNGAQNGETFILGQTSNVIQGLGAVENDVYMLSNKINNIMEEHPEITLKEIQNIPEILENPILVLQSKNVYKKTNNTRLVIVGAVKAQNNIPMIVAFDLHPVENKISIEDMQKVVSTYTKNKALNSTKLFIESSNVLYMDNEKTNMLLHTIGFQHAYRIEHTGYVGNISYRNDQVNINSVPFTSIINDENIQYQDRTSPMTDREVLSIASNMVEAQELTEGERDALRIFQNRLGKLEDLQNRRTEEGKLYKEQQFGQNVDRSAAQETLNRMRELDRQIDEASKQVLDVERKEVLRSVLKKSRKVVETSEKEKAAEALSRYKEKQRDSAQIKKYKARIKADTDSLKSWINRPDNKNIYKHVPDVIKDNVISFLLDIDFTSKQQLRGGAATKADMKFEQGLNKLRNTLKKAEAGELYAGYVDLPPYFIEQLDKFIDATRAVVNMREDGFVINNMSADELKTLSKLVRVLKKTIVQMNSFHNNAMFSHVFTAGDSSIEYMKEINTKERQSAIGATVSDFAMWQQMRPAYCFERFGKGGISIYDEFRQGQARLAFNAIKIKDFAEATYSTAEVKAWEETHNTIDLNGEKITLPVSYIMGLYELSKRPQALGHLLGAGIRIASHESGKGTKKTVLHDVGHALTPSDLQKIINTLTPRQKEVADQLQRYMAKQGGEWGNYVSVARFGEEQFGEEHYYPINSDGRHLEANADEKPGNASLYALLNMSFTKELTQDANNRIVLYSIFDVFANHMASMAQYNAFALPVLDCVKWFNYKQVDEVEGSKILLDSVREEMARVYGTPVESRPGRGSNSYAESFVLGIIKAFNGTETQGIAQDTFGINALHRYNMAAVAYNFRVVVQQPMAITRAGMLIDVSNILKGMKLKPSEIEKNKEEMLKYSGIAAWKSLGFYDINISRGLTDVIKHKETLMDKIGDVGMWGAEKADELTWSAIWSACKEQTLKGDLTEDDYLKKVSKLFEEVIYKTQVVDSVLTKNEYLRSKGAIPRMLGSFMSEPTTTASMLLNGYEKFTTDMQRGMSFQQALKKNGRNIARLLVVYNVGAVMLAAVQAVLDAWRDDDDYGTFMEKWLNQFKGNLFDEIMPINKLPILSQVYDLAKRLANKLGYNTYGNPPRTVILQWSDDVVDGVGILHDYAIGKDTNYTLWGGIYKMLQGVSGLTGLPITSATREITSAWNNTVGAILPDKKIKTYEPSDSSEIKYSWQDGYLSDEEAMKALVEKGVAEDINKAYFYVERWKDDESSSSDYYKVYKAMKSGEGFADAYNEMLQYGYESKDINTQIKKKIRAWYLGTDKEPASIDRTEAAQMLVKYGKLAPGEVQKLLSKWDSQ